VQNYFFCSICVFGVFLTTIIIIIIGVLFQKKLYICIYICNFIYLFIFLEMEELISWVLFGCFQ